SIGSKDPDEEKKKARESVIANLYPLLCRIGYIRGNSVTSHVKIKCHKIISTTEYSKQPPNSLPIMPKAYILKSYTFWPFTFENNKLNTTKSRKRIHLVSALIEYRNI
ncbi:hypothetical protein NQ317_013824, partial [Molorchus minor]